MLKPSYKDTSHKMNAQHLHRYFNEFVCWHNLRNLETLNQMQRNVAGMIGRWLMYRDLVGEKT